MDMQNARTWKALQGLKLSGGSMSESAGFHTRNLSMALF